VVSDLEQAGLVKASAYEPSSITGFSEEQAKMPPSERGEPERFVAPDALGLDGASVLDVHPLLREYFGQQVREEYPAAFREGHRRLYEHLKASVPYWPEGLGGLQPLYQAVAHGCQAGFHQEACDRVYFDRIKRRQESYSLRQLGAFSAELGALAWFFEDPWRRVAAALSERVQGLLLNEAAYCLRAVGRLTEALEPVRAGVEMAVREADWENVARYWNNLSQLELTLGDVSAALRDAEKSVEYADRSNNAFQRRARRTALADALHQAGKGDNAMALFREAEVMQAKWQPQYPLLYSLQGFRYCELLLAGAERGAWLGAADANLAEVCRTVVMRANQTLEWMMQQRWLLAIALDHLTLGRAELYLSILEPSDRDARRAATVELNAAVDGLRASGSQDHLPRGLLSRAWLFALEGDPTGARADLDEAWEIAERGPMRLFMADVHLYRARLIRDREELGEARRMITELGYGRRNEELEDAERAATGWAGT
jgi:tetratricopeptide (TPR) repeat protein